MIKSRIKRFGRQKKEIIYFWLGRFCSSNKCSKFFRHPKEKKKKGATQTCRLCRLGRVLTAASVSFWSMGQNMSESHKALQKRSSSFKQLQVFKPCKHANTPRDQELNTTNWCVHPLICFWKSAQKETFHDICFNVILIRRDLSWEPLRQAASNLLFVVQKKWEI